MKTVVAEDLTHEFSLPAPWGSIVLTQALEELWEINISFEACQTPSTLPSCLTYWEEKINAVFSSGALLTDEDVKRLMMSHRGSNLSVFARDVLTYVAQIPAGVFKTYGDVAKALHTNSSRAVAQVLAHNPFLILIPCHRVVAKDALKALETLTPEALRPKAYRGNIDFSSIGLWLRLNDLRLAG